MFGAGYVGLVTGACFAELGHDVVIRDVLPDRIERLQAGEVPIYEPGLDLVLERNSERIRFTLDVGEAVEGADFLYVAVGTPPTESGDADLRAVWSVVDEIPAHLHGQPAVVMQSTVPVGTGEPVRSRPPSRTPPGCRHAPTPASPPEGSPSPPLHHPVTHPCPSPPLSSSHPSCPSFAPLLGCCPTPLVPNRQPPMLMTFGP